MDLLLFIRSEQDRQVSSEYAEKQSAHLQISWTFLLLLSSFSHLTCLTMERLIMKQLLENYQMSSELPPPCMSLNLNLLKHMEQSLYSPLPFKSPILMKSVSLLFQPSRAIWIMQFDFLLLLCRIRGSQRTEWSFHQSIQD